MFKKHAAFVFLCAVALAVPALAQQTGNVAELNIHTPKPGSTDKVRGSAEEAHGLAQGPEGHLDLEHLGGRLWTGQRHLLHRSFGHAWKDFDGHEKFSKDDEADFAKNIGPDGRAVVHQLLRPARGPEPPPHPTPIRPPRTAS